MTAADPSPKTHSFNLPPGMVSATGIVCSPNGNQIAWLAQTQDTLRGATGISIPSGAKSIRYGIWVSGIHGQRMRRVGSVVYPTTSLAPAWYFKLRWLPSGRALSYIQDSSLWTLPVL